MLIARLSRVHGLRIAILAAAVFSVNFATGQTSLLYGVSPGAAKAEIRGSVLTLSNQMLTAQWSVGNGQLSGMKVEVPGMKTELALPRDPFFLRFKGGITIRASEMKVMDGPRVQVLDGDPKAARGAERVGGQSLSARLQDSGGRVSVVWRAILRDGSNYLRQEITISAIDRDEPIAAVDLFEEALPGARVIGSVKGSPVTTGDFFLGFEDPLAQCEARAIVTCGMKRELPLQKGQTVVYSSVIGVSPAGQMRRGFLNYVERERAHPYRTFLHYNSWYDIGYGKPYDAAAVLDVIQAFGTELVRKRGVKLSSFLLDDGWDDPHSMWQENSGFPKGLLPLTDAARQYGAGIGIWLSPWGGYSDAKKERLEFGRKNGFETNAGGFALSGPKYYARFKQVSLDFIERDGVNQFKIDGTGNVNSVFSGSNFDSDFAAAIRLIESWRARSPELYVNLTTGTYPSPFWLRYADSIWRGGDDHSFAGVGSWREKWITYRDAETYRNVVRAGPLFPLNALMLHGLIYARQAQHLGADPGNDFANEVHAYFGSGTQLQELYISHALLSANDWDILAEAANWSQQNAETLRDTHWIGGDPGKLEVYGWAAWSPEKAILTLRNPNDRQQSLQVDVGQGFELPAGAPRRFAVAVPWKQNSAPPISLAAGEPHTFTLKPFEVLTLEATPVQ